MDKIIITAPASKSLSHRALICAALAPGKSTLFNVLDSQDLERTRQCLELLGAQCLVNKDQVVVQGLSPQQPKSKNITMEVGESGTTCRLLLGVVSALPGTYTFMGQGRMHDRPVGPLTTALKAQGLDLSFHDQPGYLPLQLMSTGLPGGSVSINLEQSSQYLSALLLAAPLAASPTTIYLQGQSIASWPYIALTLESMAHFGIKVDVQQRTTTEWQSCALSAAQKSLPQNLRFKIQPGKYIPGSWSLEGDWSSASYFLAAGALGQVPVQIRGLNPQSTQGDRALVDILKQMQARIKWTEDGVVVYPSTLKGALLDMSTCPDLVPTVAVLAAWADQETIITGAAHLSLKECDRIAAPVQELSKIGVQIQGHAQGLRIQGQKLKPGSVHLSTHNDHRMAMSLALLELGGWQVHLDDTHCVAKSFPEFWKSWAKIRQGNDLGEQP